MTTLLNGGAIYGDAVTLSGVELIAPNNGSDSITVTTMKGGLIDGGVGNDTITVTQLGDGTILGQCCPANSRAALRLILLAKSARKRAA